MSSVGESDPTQRRTEELAAALAERCSVRAGRPRWPNSWSSSERYRAELWNVGDFQVLVEDIEGSESDAHGYVTFTERHVKIFRDDTLFVHGHKKVQGLDEFDGGGHGDSRVDVVSDVWHVARAPWTDEGRVTALRQLESQLEREARRGG